jgi:hypothetical protein
LDLILAGNKPALAVIGAVRAAGTAPLGESPPWEEAAWAADWSNFRRGAVFFRQQPTKLNMKTNVLPLIAFAAAIAAFVILPVSAVAASIAVSVTGIASILVADYGRDIEPLRAGPEIIPFDAPGRLQGALREAA